MDYYYAKAYMTERLEEAENRRLVALSRRPNELTPLARLAERWLGRSSQPIGAVPAVFATAGIAIETDCCAA